MCQKMRQYACQRFAHFFNKNSNFVKIFKNNYTLGTLNHRNYRSSVSYNLSAGCRANLQTCNKIRILKLESNKIFLRSKVTKVEEEKVKEKYFNIIPSYQKLKHKARLTNSLSVWGVAGAVAYLASHELGSLAYGIATIPFAILNFNALRVICTTFKRDIVFSQRYMRARLVDLRLARRDMNLGDCFDELARSYTNEVMMYFDENKWTYKQVEILANKITNYFLSLNYEKGDVVAIMVTNRPEYITLVIGLAKIGVVSALINTNVKADALVHSIQLSDCKGLIVSEDMLMEFEKIKSKVSPDVQIFQLGGKTRATKNYTNLSKALSASPDRTPEIVHKVNQSDPLIYIYTSCTNSLPKAAVLSHSKFIKNSIGVASLLNLGVNDVIYAPLPLYHSTGIIAGTGPSIVSGIPVVIRRKFSATRYWPDCIKYKCTIGQYVGDICRYLLLQPPSSQDKTHGVKKMIGTGLNRGTWKDFARRFNVEITELYGATEGNYSIINIDGKAGAVGFIPSFLPQFLHPVSIIEVDSTTLEPVRNSDGLCKISIHGTSNKYNNPGMLITPIKSQFELASSYLINQNTQNIIENVFKKGDRALITGDIMVMDKLGYIYFMDKTEDTYRWKSKTVTTMQVESVIEHLTDHSQCAVYGVSIPGVEGKAGMALIVDPVRKINFKTLPKELEKHLPHCACPVFVRLSEDASACKVEKSIHVQEGFDPTKIKDRLYYINKESGIYEPLTEDIYRNILNKNISF